LHCVKLSQISVDATESFLLIHLLIYSWSNDVNMSSINSSNSSKASHQSVFIIIKSVLLLPYGLKIVGRFPVSIQIIKVWLQIFKKIAQSRGFGSYLSRNYFIEQVNKVRCRSSIWSYSGLYHFLNLFLIFGCPIGTCFAIFSLLLLLPLSPQL